MRQDEMKRCEMNHILNCGYRYESEHDPRSWMNNLSGWKRAWKKKKKKKKLETDRESQPERRNAQSIALINPTGEQAIVSS